MELENQVLSTLKVVFDQTSINTDSVRDSIPNWDSFGHLNLIMELESTFSISLTIEETLEIKSVKDVIRLVSDKKSA